MGCTARPRPRSSMTPQGQPRPLWTPAMLEALRWPTQVAPSEWADRHRVLGIQASEPGPWKTSRVPHTREWMDCAATPWVRRVTIVKSTQVGGSESLLNVIGYAIAEDPGPMLFVMPSREAGEEYCDRRVLPMVEACPVLKGLLGEDRGDRKLRLLKFRGADVLFRTARVATDLSQYAIRWLFGDEAEQWPQDVGTEGSPWNVALERVRTFRGRWKAYLNSTPLQHDGLVWTQYLAGDRRRFHVPCPHCKERIAFEWRQVRWPKDIVNTEEMLQRREAWYECQACGGKITDRQKIVACLSGEWIPEGRQPNEWLSVRGTADRATHRSYQMWAAYSPWLTWAELVAKFLELMHAGHEREWTNKWLGLPWTETAVELAENDLERCRRPYRRGDSAPEGVLWITAGVDTQEHYLPFVVRGWGLDGRSWLLAHGRASSFAELGEILFRTDWSGGDHRRANLQVRLTLVDQRWREQEVADFARRWGSDWVRMSKGSAFKGAQAFTLKRLDHHPVTGETIRGGLLQVALNTDLFKGRVATAIAAAAKGADEGALLIYEDVDDTYLHEMTSEHRVVDRSKAEPVLRWEVKPGRRANHYWDAETLAFAAARMLLLDQARAEQQRSTDGRPPHDPGPPLQLGDDDDGMPDLWRPR